MIMELSMSPLIDLDKSSATLFREDWNRPSSLFFKKLAFGDCPRCFFLEFSQEKKYML
jgi:hypothetical protein